MPEATFSLRPANDADDLSLGLLDAWATMADVVSFYQERIVAEGYLRTAVEDRSLREFAAMVGHEPKPPTSATTWLVMTVEESPDGVRTTVDAGTQVQSVPSDGGDPQVFEVERDAQVRSAWNALRPRRLLPAPRLVANPHDGRLEAQGPPDQSNLEVRELFLAPSKVVLTPGKLLFFAEWQSGVEVMRSVAVRIKTVSTMDGGIQRVTLDSVQFQDQAV